MRTDNIPLTENFVLTKGKYGVKQMELKMSALLLTKARLETQLATCALNNISSLNKTN